MIKKLDITDKFIESLIHLEIPFERVNSPCFIIGKYDLDNIHYCKEACIKGHRFDNWEAACCSLEGFDRDKKIYLYEAFELDISVIYARYHIPNFTMAEFAEKERQWCEVDRLDPFKNFNAAYEI